MKLLMFNRSAVVMACMTLLSACTSIMDADKINYKTQGSVKTAPLDIPPDLTQLSKDTRYSLPNGSVTASGMSARAADPLIATTAANQVNDVRLERDGKIRWLSVNRPADAVWPVVHQFWEDNGFQYVIDQQSLGLLETEWAENRAKIPQDFLRSSIGKVFDGLYSSGERDKYRTRIERNGNGGVDIYITHRGMSEEYKDQTKTNTIWMPRPSDPELEAEFLTRLMVKLGVAAEQAKTTVAKSTAPMTRVSLENDAGKLVLNDSYDVAWRRVGVSLDRTGFTVEDRDRAQGIYFVRYVDTLAKEEKGFFARMFSSDKTEKGLVKSRIAVKNINAKVEVTVLNSMGQVENTPSTQQILKILADDLK